jgi:hypothetical protein
VILILWLLGGVGIPVVLLTYLYYMRGKSDLDYDEIDEFSEIEEGGLFERWTRRPGLNADLLWIIGYTVVSFTLYALFVRQGYLAYDWSYFAWQITGVALQIAIGARVARIFMPRPWNRYGFRLLNGAAVAYFLYFLLGGSFLNDTFTHYFYGGSPGRASSMTSILSKVAENRQYFVLGAAAVTVYMSTPFLHETGGRLSKWRGLALAISYGLVGWGLYVLFDSFSSEWGPLVAVGWAVFAGMATMALGALAGYGRNIKDALISEACIWLSSSQLRLFFIGAVITSYILFLRVFLNNASLGWVAALIEWGTFCLVVWRMYDGIRGRISDAYSVELKYTAWKRHMQLVEKQVDGEFNYAVNVQADFVERSHKDQLLVYLVTLMHDNGMSVEEISEVLHPLAEYSDMRIPVFAFTRKREQIRKGNREKRDTILKDIMGALTDRDIVVA